LLFFIGSALVLTSILLLLIDPYAICSKTTVTEESTGLLPNAANMAYDYTAPIQDYYTESSELAIRQQSKK